MEASKLIDRRQLKRRLNFWRVVAVLAVLALVALAVERSEVRKGDRVARITIDGIIVQDRDRDRALFLIAKNDKTKALIVRINSPGGSTTGSEELYLGLRRVAEEKPVVAVIGTLGASGGYIAALAAERIYVRETSLTGSIGVVMETAEISGLLEKLGIKAERIASGPLKGRPSGTEAMDDQVRAALQALIDDAQAWFVGLVRERRELDDVALRQVTDGRVFTGRQALAEALVDAIGGEREARDWLERERKIDRDLPMVEVRWGEDASFLGRLFNRALTGWLPRPSLGLDGLVAVWHPSLSSARLGARLGGEEG